MNSKKIISRIIFVKKFEKAGMQDMYIQNHYKSVFTEIIMPMKEYKIKQSFVILLLSNYHTGFHQHDVIYLSILILLINYYYYNTSFIKI